MTENDGDSLDAYNQRTYWVGQRGLNGAATGFAQLVTVRLAHSVESLTSGPPLCARVLESGTVRTEVFAEDAIRIVSPLRIIAGLLSVAGMAPEGVISSGAEAEPVTTPGRQIEYPIHPTLYAMRPGVDYAPGLRAAFAARAALRDVLRGCLPRGPLAVVPLANVYGRGIVRVDLTPADAERLVVLLSYARHSLARGR